MATHIDEYERKYYQTALTSTATNLGDLKRQFFLSELGLTSGSVVDLEKRWLRLQGASEGNNNDMWRSFLIQTGYSGNLQDMKLQYYIDNS